MQLHSHREIACAFARALHNVDRCIVQGELRQRSADSDEMITLLVCTWWCRSPTLVLAQSAELGHPYLYCRSHLPTLLLLSSLQQAPEQAGVRYLSQVLASRSATK